MIAAHIGPKELIGQIGNADADHAYWGRPEEMTMDRPALTITETAPGSDLAGDTAAALAAASMFYDSIGESGLANQALDHARELFTFADENRGLYSDSIPEAQGFYTSSSFNDELLWSAGWMFKATGENEYLVTAEEYYVEFGFEDIIPGGFGWSNKHVGGIVLLYEATLDSKYEKNLNQFIQFLKDHTYTPQGLIYLSDWGSLREAANVAQVCLQIAELGIEEVWCNDFAETQLNYLLGDTGRSYIVGWGENPPQGCHHRAASCEDMPSVCDDTDFEKPDPNPQALTGALVGGPDETDSYVDDRHDYQHNEVTLDYNAGYQGLLAAQVAKYAET